MINMDEKISVTNSAIKAIQDKLTKRETPNSYFRVGVKGSGCSGFSYFLDFFDKEPNSQDSVFVFSDIKIIIDSKSLKILNGIEIDWQKSLLYEGFKFNNPNIKATCSCGISFEI